MKTKFKIQPNDPPHVFMCRAGYARHANRDGEISYVRRVAGLDFPRFHVYVAVEKKQTILSVHIDQKGVTYDGSHAHSGEYAGATVEKELRRIQAALNIPLVVLLNPKGQPLDR